VRLNECIKIVKYVPGGAIVPHQDGPWVPFEDQASIYTLLIYLNNDFQGGQTMMTDYSEYGPRSRPPLEYVRPEPGKALVFDHRLVHSGEKVTGGVKYILRAEIIFQRTSQLRPAIDSMYQYLDTPEYIRARQLYDESRESEMNCDKENFVMKYKQVLELQCIASTSHDSMNDLVLSGNYEKYRICWILLLQYLCVSDMPSIMLASKSFYRLSRSGEIWQHFTYLKYPPSLSTPVPGFRPPPSCCIDWYNIYKNRIHHTNNFTTLVIHIGIDYVSYASRLPFKLSHFSKYSLNDRHILRTIPYFLPHDPHEYTFGHIKSEFCDVFKSDIMIYAYPYHLNMPDYARFIPSSLSDPPPPSDYRNASKYPVSDEVLASHFENIDSSPQQISKYIPLVMDNMEPINWNVCAAIIRLFVGLQPYQSVMLLMGPYEYLLNSKYCTDDVNNVSNNKYIYDNTEPIFAFQHVLCTPAVRIEHMGIALLAKLGFSDGYIVFVVMNRSLTDDRIISTHVMLTAISKGVIIYNNYLFSNPSCSASIEDIVNAVIDSIASLVHSGEWKTNLMHSIPIVTYAFSRDFPEIKSHYDSLSSAISIEILNTKKFSLRHLYTVYPLGDNDDTEVVQGGIILSTMADHRSKCTFQPFA
jgi:hypothetical protein